MIKDCENLSNEIERCVDNRDYFNANVVLGNLKDYCSEIKETGLSHSQEIIFLYNYSLAYIKLNRAFEMLESNNFEDKKYDSYKKEIEIPLKVVEDINYRSYYPTKQNRIKDLKNRLSGREKEIEDSAEKGANYGCAIFAVILSFVVMLIWYFIGDLAGWIVILVPLIIGIITFFKMRKL